MIILYYQLVSFKITNEKGKIIDLSEFINIQKYNKCDSTIVYYIKERKYSIESSNTIFDIKMQSLYA